MPDHSNPCMGRMHIDKYKQKVKQSAEKYLVDQNLLAKAVNKSGAVSPAALESPKESQLQFPSMLILRQSIK